MALSGKAGAQDGDVILTPHGYMMGRLEQLDDAPPFEGGVWYNVHRPEDGLTYLFEEGVLAGMQYLTADLLVDGSTLLIFQIVLQEANMGPTFTLTFSALNQCQARIRMTFDALNLNVWRYEREGAWLKPYTGGYRVDLAKVNKMMFKVIRKADGVQRFCLTDFVATARTPAKLTDPVLPAGPLIDELGQSTIHDWPERTHSAKEMVARVESQLSAAPSKSWPEGWSKWGGWKEKTFDATGFFRTEHDGERWWLVDPDGCAFWSAGMDCVRSSIDAAYGGLESALEWMPPKLGEYASIYTRNGEQVIIDYHQANFIRAFGADWHPKWAEISLSQLRDWGFNTVANWSEWEIAREAGFPYVRPLNVHKITTRRVYRDMPDVFDPSFARDAQIYAADLEETKGDPALIGYFMMNEPKWAFALETPAKGMLYNTPECATREALADFARDRYGTDAALAEAWEIDVTFDELAKGKWTKSLNAKAESDLADFSAVMVERFFGTLADACRAVDPNHLNLGIRYYTVPPAWAVEGMRKFDVFSMNCYQERVPPEQTAEIAALLDMPVMVGEWHFGALDVGLPGSGIGHVKDQDARGQAFRFYVENAAALPSCVGVHYFTLYDESALGRFDGENWNIGFLDICNRPYEPLTNAARTAHERLYDIAAGKAKPTDDAPRYLPKLFN
jgi:hypothetical protein